MNNNKIKGINAFYVFLIAFYLFSCNLYASDKKSMDTLSIKKYIESNISKHKLDEISSNNVVFDERNSLFIALNETNVSLDIIDNSNKDSIKLKTRIDLKEYGNKVKSFAVGHNFIVVSVENQPLADSSNIIFYNKEGVFLKQLRIIPNVNKIAYDEAENKIYISHLSQLGLSLTTIDLKDSIQNLSPASVETLSFEKEQAGEVFVKVDPSGFGMTIIAMSVVFTSLIFLYLVFKALGRYNIRKSKKKKQQTAKIEEKAVDKNNEEAPGEVFAAIACALHLYQSQLHDEETTVITIEKVARTYSPWSSKIYGLRRMPKN